jgi:hypothetical protein
MSISATITIDYNWGGAIALSLTNAYKVGYLRLRVGDGSFTDTNRISVEIQDASGSWMRLKYITGIDLRQFTKIELFLIDDTYTYYINGEEIFSAKAVDYAVSSYKYNMIINNSDSNATWLIKEMTYKEW